MSYYFILSLFVVAVCDAGIITNVDHSHHAVYHGLGATSYQNVQVENHDTVVVPANYGDPAELQESLKHHHETVIPIVESHNDVDHIVSHSAPYEEFTIDDIKLKSDDVLEHYFDDDHDHYSHHL